MKIDLTKIDYTKEITEQLKEQYKENIEKLASNHVPDNTDDKEIVLFHGTTVSYLNKILLEGLSPNKVTNNSNFQNNLKANEHLIYLTNKWHYWYAHQASLNVVRKDDSLYFPCYIECKVKESKLVIDEDFVHSKYVKNRIKTALKKQQKFLDLSYSESLNQYATVAHIGEIKREDIISFTIISNIELFTKRFIDKNSQYQKDLLKWGNGKGKGSLKLIDLFNLEDDRGNLTFYLKDIPKNNIITGIIPKDGDLGFSLKLGEFQEK